MQNFTKGSLWQKCPKIIYTSQVVTKMATKYAKLCKMQLVAKIATKYAKLSKKQFVAKMTAKYAN